MIDSLIEFSLKFVLINRSSLIHNFVNMTLSLCLYYDEIINAQSSSRKRMLSLSTVIENLFRI